MNQRFFHVAGMLVMLFFLPPSEIYAQRQAGSAFCSGEKSIPLGQVTDLNSIGNQWMFRVQNVDVRHPANPLMDSIKQAQMERKLLWEATHLPSSGSLNKSDQADPIVGTSFNANFPDGAVPNDNSIAISNGGTIVSAVNSNFSMYSQAGALIKSVNMFDFAQNGSLGGTSFDPRVQYDPEADRFIIVYLNGFTGATSKVVVAFSQTNNPAGAWNLYFLDGDAIGSNHWTDYPNIGITHNELFITGSLFSDSKAYQQAVVWQIQKQAGYAGTGLTYQIWSNIQDGMGAIPFTLVPMSGGNATSTGPAMYFVSTEGPGGNRVNLFEITNELSSSNEELRSEILDVADYIAPASANMKNTTLPLNTGDCRVKNGFILNGYIHFVFASDFGNGFSGVNYGRLKLDTRKLDMRSFGTPGLDYCYPSIAWFGTDISDKSVVIQFLSSGNSIFPEIRAMNCDDNLFFSKFVLVKAGDNFFQVIAGEQRWGDYTGIASKFNSPTPSVWIAGGFPRLDKKYGNWIAELSPGIATGVKQFSAEKGDLQLFPNPAHKMFNLNFTMPSTEFVTISLTDQNGKIVKTFYRDQLKAGANQLSFNEDLLTAGVYYLQVTGSNAVLFTEKLVVQ